MSTSLNSPVNTECKPQGVLVIDESRTVVFVDERASAILGLDPVEVIGKPCSEFVHIFPCAEESCSLGGNCRMLHSDAPLQEVARSNSSATFRTQVALNRSGERIGTIHLVTLPKSRPASASTAKDRPEAFGAMIGNHPSMLRLFDLIQLVAPTDVTAQIFGASGVGKELIAEALHSLSDRKGNRLVKLNCSTIPTTLLESTLFGHVKGAFTGAIKDTEGFVEHAEGGTLFLDEIGDVSHDVQVKLLRLLESREYSRVGENRTRSADIRIVTATNQDLKQLVSEGKIREDFFYRINVFPITVPRLKERESDIPLLAQHFVRRFNKRFKKTLDGVSPEALKLLTSYDWPGNVRELQHAIEHAFVKAANGYILPQHLPDLGDGTSPQPITGNSTVEAERSSPLPLTAENIAQQLSLHRRNVSRTAEDFGVSRVTLWKYMKRFGIER